MAIGKGFNDSRPAGFNVITQPGMESDETSTIVVKTGGKGQDGRRAFAASDTPSDSLASNLADPSKTLSNY
jgi:hypothetical protein